ncbi:hypothetical protein [Anaerostipes sp. AF04-45]|uniref:hypothetical protein n=1 Tax=Anaerostipes sp. AF04-45 TaxID=2292912 RepID=UPI000E4FE05B|nr:hypothetical protein [Anaerostipes sp. AF04-45]RGH20263.1 hypothetical protein DWV34_16880 [Anaerostipes sp. AF04-45]
MVEKSFINKKDSEILMSRDEYNQKIAETLDKYMMKIDVLKNENKQLKEMNDYLITSLIGALNYLKNSD